MSTQRRGLLFALLGAVSGGAFMIPWKMATAEGSTSSMVLVMSVAAALVNSAVLLLPQPARADRPRGELRLTLVLAAVFAGLTLAGNAASAASAAQLSAPMVSVLLRSDVIIIAVLGWLFLGERADLRFWLGAAVAGAGLWIVQAPSAAGVALSPVGLGLGLLAAACFSCMGVLTRRFIRRIDPVALNAWRLWAAVILWFLVEGPHLPADLTPRLVGLAALAALIGPGLGRLALMFSARDLEARVTAMVGLSGPLWAVLFAWIVLGTLPQGREWVGGALLLLGVAIPLLRRPAAPEP